MKVADLNSLYNDAEANLSELHSEQRSNLLLIAGNHYAKRNSRFFQAIRGAKDLPKDQKIRLTKNHIQKITKLYVNSLISLCPGVKISPKNKTELQDQKDADLNSSVWEDIKYKKKFNRLVRKLAQDYMGVGEIWVKCFHDPNAGKIIAQELIQEADNTIRLDHKGEPVTSPVFAGDLVFERYAGFNVLTDPDARSFEECTWVCLRKMIPIATLKKVYAKDEAKLAFISESAKQTYKLFDGSTGAYSSGRGLVMIREYYFRPTPDAPNGYFYYTTEFGILEQGELPLGEFPIFFCGFDELETSCRAYSLIKQLRPYQAEVNRTASKIAEHQMTIGDDKIITQAGATMSPGGTAHGIKHVKVTGGVPTILPGRAGDQYLPYMQSQIGEMYSVANLDEEGLRNEETAQLDPYAMLFRAMKDKKKYSIYATKFEELLVDLCEMALKLKRAYVQDQELIQMIGRNEWVNIPEFRSSNDMCYEIMVEPMSDDIESKMGKQLVFNHLIQYAGQQLPPEELGKIIRAMPYANEEEALGDLTLDYDNAKNDLLALDRGEVPEPRFKENHQYLIKRLVHRMKQPDFRMLDPKIQQNYNQKYEYHVALLQQEQQELARAQSGYIPSGGYSVACDFYVQDQNDPTKQKRLRIPSEALDWLIKKLEEQGSNQESLAMLDQQSQAQILAGGFANQQEMPSNVVQMPNQGMY